VVRFAVCFYVVYFVVVVWVSVPVFEWDGVWVGYFFVKIIFWYFRF